MAQQNQHNNELGGFANPQFVLINGVFWNSNQTRRYIQGQVWLNEFTDILLRCLLQISGKRPMWKGPIPLEEKGSGEILRYAEKAEDLHNHSPVIVARDFYKIRLQRNIMTHEVRKWNQSNDHLKELLIQMTKTASNLEPCFSSGDLHSIINDFRSKCERELEQMDDVDHESLY
ncbi:uncharacterized protein LOC116924707 [Daphnia magna]|uniref:uncharacterized protein LOC116924707 n=1 Tax=Daphnia magna TaxID=35525 RepID=UPI001E1BA0D7|nr:uncharacterized protein LOC116924707 [Daphnia magna]